MIKNFNKELAQNLINDYCYNNFETKDLLIKYNVNRNYFYKILHGAFYKDCIRPNNLSEITKSKKILFKKGNIKYINAPPLNDFQLEIINGSLLGDGHISNARPNSCFSKGQKASRIDYVKWHYDILIAYNPSLDYYKGNNSYRVYTCEHPVFTDLRKIWYINKKKIVPKDLKLTPLIVAIWFFDDGTNDVKRRTIKISTQSFTFEETDILISKLTNFNIKSYTNYALSKKTGNKMPVLCIKGENYIDFINLVKEYCIWDCFKYKINSREKYKPRITYGAAKITLDIAKNIREDSKILKQKELSNKYKLAQSTISRILHKKFWKEENAETNNTC